MEKILSKKNLKYQEGMGLVEVIAAIGIATLTITALVSLSISTLRTSLDSKLLLEGSKIANREIELVRAFRDGGENIMDTFIPRTWEDFIGAVEGCTEENPCHIDLGTLVPFSGTKSDPPSGPLSITRGFYVTDTGGNPIQGLDPIPQVVRVSVSVSWMVGSQQKGAYIYTDLSNWRGR